MAVKYHVRLDDSEREMLKVLIEQKKPAVAQHKKRHAQILLAIDENNDPLTHEQAAKAFNVKPLAICRLRQRLSVWLRKVWRLQFTANYTQRIWVWFSCYDVTPLMTKSP